MPIRPSRFLSICAATLAAALAVPAVAGPLDEAKVKARIAATARGDVDALMAEYSDDCVFQWVGGALDGEYRGKAAIREVWTKFKANQGDMILVMGKVDSNTNPKGVTVNAYADYKGKMEVKVRQVFVYRDGKLAMEIWQIDPALAFTQ
jgi:hypothetical protein